MEAAAGYARYVDFGMRQVESEVLIQIFGQGGSEGLAVGIFQQPTTTDKFSDIFGRDGDLDVFQKARGSRECQLNVQLLYDMLDRQGRAACGEMSEKGLESRCKKRRREPQWGHMGIEGGSQVAEEDVAYGRGHLDEQQRKRGEADGRGRGIRVAQQERIVLLLVVVEGDMEAASSVWRHVGGDSRCARVFGLQAAVNPGILVAKHLPAAVVERAQGCRLLGGGKVDLDAAHVVAFELVLEALGMGARGVVDEEGRVAMVQRG